MKTFKRIDLDSLPCSYIERRIEENKLYDRSSNPVNRFIIPRQWRTLGLAPEKLFDWRGLERRWFQLHSHTLAANTMLWDIYKKLSKYSHDAGGAGIVWVPAPHGETCDVYEPGDHFRGLQMRTNVSAKELIAQASQKPDIRPYVVAGEDLDRLHRYSRRIKTMQRRTGPYWLAWHISVESRLEAYVQRPENRLHFHAYNDCKPCAFVFNNDDRAYLVTSNGNGNIEWHDDVIVHIDR